MSDNPGSPRRRRPRYPGTHPRRFEQKYKEHAPERYPETIDKVLASGKTPAGSHVPIMVEEVVATLDPHAGEIIIDCTLGYGGHARELLPRVQPGGLLLGLDVDPLELPKTEERLRRAGFGRDVFRVRRSNFAGLPKALAQEELAAADCILADLGVSSMQLDDPVRGFAIRTAGPVDMRMNPQRGQPASTLLTRITPGDLASMLEDVEEPESERLAHALAGRFFGETPALANAVRAELAGAADEDQELSVRRVFLALRMAVNEELNALDALLRHLPQCLTPGGRAAIITFHSGEDRRVKKAFRAGLGEGLYSAIADEVIRASAEECHANPRAKSAKLRWARRSR